MAAGVKTGGRAKGTPNKVNSRAPTVDKAVVAKFPAYRVERVDRLVPYARNARTHSPGQVAKIAGSLREFGFTNPVLIDAKRGIIAGHGRVLAAQQLGMETVPVIELSHLTAAQRRAYVLADNRLALDAGWDEELLALELGELRDGGFDLSFTGFDAKEISDIFAVPAELDATPGLGDGLQYQIVVECEDENDQAATLQWLEAEGKKARPLML